MPVLAVGVRHRLALDRRGGPFRYGPSVTKPSLRGFRMAVASRNCASSFGVAQRVLAVPELPLALEARGSLASAKRYAHIAGLRPVYHVRVPIKVRRYR